jgi:hypothetical protein
VRPSAVLKEARPTTQLDSFLSRSPGAISSFFLSHYECWLCDEGELLVEFDDNGMAKDVHIFRVIPFGRPTIAERIREWAGL